MSTVAESIEAGQIGGCLWMYSNYHCNMTCKYCLTGSSPRAPRRLLGAERMLELTREAAQLGFTSVGVGATLVAALFGVLGCSEYVAYDEDFRLPGSTPTTLDGFAPTTLSHLQLRGLIARYTSKSKDGMYVLVDYDGLAASPEARLSLDQYRTMLASVNPTGLASTSERLAYWVNGYNASVIHGVLTNYKGKATWKATDSGKFFDDPIFTFGGQAMTLNHLEQGVMRGDWSYPGMPRSGKLLAKLQTWHKELWGNQKVDARIHAAINCAAISCPNLLSTAPYVFEAATIKKQLEAATTAWLDSPEKGAGPNGISALFQWYTKDYQAHHASVKEFIAAYRTDGLKNVDTSRYLTYDWTLNIKGAK